MMLTFFLSRSQSHTDSIALTNGDYHHRHLNPRLKVTALLNEHHRADHQILPSNAVITLMSEA